MQIKFLIFLLLLSGCATPFKKEKAPDVVVPLQERHALVFVVDGLGGPLAEQLLRIGFLPNFKRHLYDRGLWVEEVTSVFPSVTAAAMTSVMTGTYPARHGITNFQWVDRTTGDYRCYIGSDIFEFNKDIDLKVKTLFQHFPKEETASFGLLINRGVGHSDSLIYTALNPIYGIAPRAHVVLNDFLRTFLVGKKFPRVMSCYEWYVDDRGHRKGARGLETLRALRRADKNFGKLVDMYQKEGRYNQTYFVLISDHGMAPVRRRFYVDEYLKEKGFKTKIISWNLGESHIPKEWDRLESLFGSGGKVYGSDAVIGAAGGGCATVDLVRNGGRPANGEKEAYLWRDQLKYSEVRNYKLRNGNTVDVLELLIKPKAVDFVLVRDDTDGKDNMRCVRIVNREGETKFSRLTVPGEGHFYKYEVVCGKDPLDQADEHQIRPFVASGQFYEEKVWFEALRGEDYPDAVVQYCQIFDSPRSATLYVCAGENWSFNSIIKGKHAGPLEEEMLATFCIAGPGIAHGKASQARIVDMVPTVLTVLGVAYDPTQLDGKPLPEAIQATSKSH